MSKQVVYSNESYDVTVIPYRKSEADETTIINCYGVVNRQTGVIEMWEMMLANAIVYADKMNSDLSELWRSKQDNPTVIIN